MNVCDKSNTFTYQHLPLQYLNRIEHYAKNRSRKMTACKSVGPTFNTVKMWPSKLIRSNVLNWKIDVELKNKSNQDNASRTFQHQFNFNYTRNIIAIGSECCAIRLCFILMFYALFWLHFLCVLNEVTAHWSTYWTCQTSRWQTIWSSLFLSFVCLICI